VQEVSTDQQGAYHTRPLDSVFTYELEASKDDYLFVKADGNNFQSHKLAKLTVIVKDKHTGELVDDVFLSLSAGKIRLSQ